MATARSPAIRIYRRSDARFEALRETLVRHDFHAIVPPDALAEWEYADDRSVRVLLWQGAALIEAPDDALAAEFDRQHRLAFPWGTRFPMAASRPSMSR